jgi:uncharacterized membrane protein YgdD (TMEM256/DUF423 family)
MSLNRPLAAAAAVSGALSVVIGAFAAHGAGPGVKDLLTTGGHYLMTHALLALACAAWPGRTRLVGIAGGLAILGGWIFCLSLALIGWTSTPAFGAVAPIGGVLMIGAWLLLALAALQRSVVAR